LTRESYLTQLQELEQAQQQTPENLAVLSALRAWESEVH
jgi:hypothetical protein